MRTLVDDTHVLDAGLADIRRQYGVPVQFPPEVVERAGGVARAVHPQHQGAGGISRVDGAEIDPAVRAGGDGHGA